MYYGVRDPRVDYIAPDPALESMTREAVRRSYGDDIAAMASSYSVGHDITRIEAAYWIAFGMAAWQHKSWSECDEIGEAAQQAMREDIYQQREEDERAEQMADEDRRYGDD